MDNNRYYDDEREIDLIDILGRIIAKWRPICVTALIGFLVGVIISCVMGYFNMKKSDVEAKKLSAAKAEAMALEKLMKEEKGEDLKENADNNLVKYINLQSLYDMQSEYNERSIYNNLDATRIAKVKLTYYIDNHYESSYPVVETYNNIDDVIAAYKTALLSDEICAGIIKDLGIDTEAQYIRELVKFEDDTKKSSGGNLEFDIVTDNPDMSMTIAEYYKGVIDEISKNISDTYGYVDAMLNNEQLYTESDFDVMTEQNEADAKLIDYYNQLQAIENSMNGAQGDYFDAILAEYNLDIIKTEAVHHGYFYYVSKKLIIIVAIACAFLAVVVYGCMYLFDGYIKTSSELAALGCSTLLGTVLVDSDKHRKNVLFDKWAIALTDKRTMCEDSDRTIHVVATSISQYLKSNAFSRVVLVGADIKHDSAVNMVCSEVEAIGAVVDTALDAFDSPETVDMVANADVVILVGEVGKSKYVKLERVLSICNLYKKPVVGTFAIQERI